MPVDSAARVRADLLTLPAMRPKYVDAYLDGDLEAGATLAVVREMRRVGWPEDVARSMMWRCPASGTGWLLDQKDPDAEFDRCWELAGRPVSQFQKPRSKQPKPFVSHVSDQTMVLAYVEAHPGLGTRELLRAGCGLEGLHREGRIKAALKVLRADGRVRTEPGPRGAVLHHVEDGLGSDSDQPITSIPIPLSIGGKRHATVRKARRKAKVWKQYQGITLPRHRTWVLLRTIADRGTLGSLYSSLAHVDIVKPTVRWKYLRALEESGFVILTEEDRGGLGKVAWVVRAASPEAVDAALSAGDMPEEDWDLWQRLRGFYGQKYARTTYPETLLAPMGLDIGTSDLPECLEVLLLRAEEQARQFPHPAAGTG